MDKKIKTALCATPTIGLLLLALPLVLLGALFMGDDLDEQFLYGLDNEEW